MIGSPILPIALLSLALGRDHTDAAITAVYRQSLLMREETLVILQLNVGHRFKELPQQEFMTPMR